MKFFCVTVKTKTGEDCFIFQANNEKEVKTAVLKFIKRDALQNISEMSNDTIMNMAKN